MELKNLRLFIIAQGVLVLLLVATAFFSATNLNRSLNLTINLTSLQEVVQASDNINAALEEERIAIGQYPLTGNQALLTRIETAQTTYDDNWQVIVDNRSEDQAQQIADIEEARVNYKSLLDQVVSEYQADPENNESADKLRDAITYYLQNLDPKFSDLTEPELEKLSGLVEIEKTRATTLSIFSRVALVFSIVVGIVVVFQVAAAVYFSRKLIGSINEIVDAANAISRGDMDVKINVDQVGEIGDLARAIERMRTSLKAAIERLRRSL